jgi:hypothetical protein
LQAFHFQSRFSRPCASPLLLIWVAISQFSHFFTQYSGITYSGKKEIRRPNRTVKDVKHWPSFLRCYYVVLGVTREIVQPAKASNFSENRLLKRASPHDTETIYQLFYLIQY